MSDLDSRCRSGVPTGAQGSVPSVQELMARVQGLVDTPRPARGYPLDWYVEALHVGDLTAIAVAALRSPGSG